MKTLWIVLIALACLVVGFVAGGVAGFFIGVVSAGRLGAQSGPPGSLQGVGITVSAPDSVKVGETFTLTIAVTDTLNKQRLIHDIDILSQYLAGATIESIDPAPASRSEIFDYAVHTMKAPISPGQTRTVTFTLRATKPGTFVGVVDVYVDSDFASETHPIFTTIEP